MNSISYNIIPYYKNAAVRDLAWALYSPGLIDEHENDFQQQWPRLSASWQPDADTTLPWLLQLDEQSDQFHHYLKLHESHRLGIYFENLLSFFFTHHPDYELEARNLAVQGQQRTLGEFDLIYKDYNQAAFIHHEVAIKFFLELQQPRTEQPWSRWIGPGCKDRFDLKLLNLLNKQCQLSTLPDAKNTLETLDSEVLSEKLIKRVLLKGCLFHHVSAAEPAHFPYANRNRLAGKWFHLSEWIDTLKNSTDHLMWLPLKKHGWMSSLNVADQEQNELVAKEALIEFCQDKLARQSYPILLGQYRKMDELWCEQERLFVVPDSWPEIS
ncbi:MAG: hypothetical protein ACI9HY_003914 [Planctomycetaceae bacterium]|jgi:hypothetical protein